MRALAGRHASAIVVAGHVLAFFFFRYYFVGHINLMCGDSALYVHLASGLRASSERPSGWPFILRGLARISNDPTMLTGFNSVCGLVAHLTVFAMMRRYVVAFAALATSSLVCMSPSAFAIAFLGFMPDTFAFSCLAVCFWLMSRSPEVTGWRSLATHAALGLTLGYLAIVKSVFFYVGALVVLCQATGLIGGRRARLLRASSLAVMVALFVAPPLTYASFYVQPRLGIAAVEGFGGRSMLANVLRFIPSCDGLAGLASVNDRAIVTEECTLEGLHDTPIRQLWTSKSLLMRLHGRLVAREAPSYYGDFYSNGVFMRWMVRAALHQPRAILSAMHDTLRTALVSPIVPDLISGNPANGIAGGCEWLIPDRLAMSVEAYNDAVDNQARARRTSIMFVFVSAGVLMTLLTALSLVTVMLGWVPLFFVIRHSGHTWRNRLLAVTFYGTSAAYMAAVSLGSSYDMRYMPPLYLSSLSFLVIVWSMAQGSEPEISPVST